MAAKDRNNRKDRQQGGAIHSPLLLKSTLDSLPWAHVPRYWAMGSRGSSRLRLHTVFDRRVRVGGVPDADRGPCAEHQTVPCLAARRRCCRPHYASLRDTL